MKVAKLQLKNVRSYGSTTIELDRVNIFRGVHGAGKTTIQLALEWLFTGACAITDAAGRGVEDLAGPAGPEAAVVATMTDGAVIARSRGRAGNALMVSTGAGVPLTGRNAEAWLAANIAPRPVIAAVLNSFRFLIMPDKDRAALLASALASEPIKLSDQALKDLATLNIACDGTVRSADEVNRLYKSAFDARTQINRDLKNLGDTALTASPHPEYSSADVKEQLETLELELVKLGNARTAGAVAYAVHKSALDVATERRKAAEPDTLEPAEIDRLQVIVRNKGQLTKLMTELAAFQRSKRDIENNRRDLDRELANALASDKTGKCGSCGQTIAGATDTRLHRIELAENALTLSNATLAQATAEVARVEKEIEALGDPDAAQRKLDAHQEAMRKWTAADGEIRKLGPLGPEPVIGDATVEEQELERRIAKGRQILGELQRWEGLHAEQEKAIERGRRLHTVAGSLERMVEYFKADGELMNSLTGERMPKFIARINEVLERFGFAFAMPDPATVLLSVQGRPPLKLGQLSESQAFRFCIALQIALAEATGVGLVVIDRADVLLPAVRDQLTEALLEASLEQVFILAASEDAELPAEIPDGVAYFNLAQDSRGATTILAAGGRAEVSYAAAE